jgi:glycosyltransferase involved in cell wall biosynthesis
LSRTFSIITTCKGRLDHLKQSLPSMVAQPAAEVIVVDYSCPEGTGDFVEANYPGVRVVRVEGQEHFSNWAARNAGASAATGEMLVFVDADTILAEGAIASLDGQLPDGAYGSFDRETSWAFSKTREGLQANQLKGFHASPAKAFHRLGGYDDVLAGYAAGADTDLEDRMPLIRVAKQPLDPVILERVLDHDAPSRVRHHAYPVRISYCAGLLYRAAKTALLARRRAVQLPLKMRERLFSAALAAAQDAAARNFEGDRVSLLVNLYGYPVLMPRQLGYKRAKQTVSLRVEISLEDRLDEAPPGGG